MFRSSGHGCHLVFPLGKQFTNSVHDHITIIFGKIFEIWTNQNTNADDDTDDNDNRRKVISFMPDEIKRVYLRNF